MSGELTHTFDDELVCASTGVDAEQAAAHRAVSDRDAGAVRPRVSRGLDRGALSDRSGGGGAALARR